MNPMTNPELVEACVAYQATPAQLELPLETDAVADLEPNDVGDIWLTALEVRRILDAVLNDELK
jgi:hypothetical protein